VKRDGGKPRILMGNAEPEEDGTTTGSPPSLREEGKAWTRRRRIRQAEGPDGDCLQNREI